MHYWLWIFGDIEGLRWVLDRSRMAFAESQAGRASQVQVGDKAILYVSRGAFRNPTRDRTRLAGTVEITGPLKSGKSVMIGDREFSSFVSFEVVQVLPERKGPDVGKLVEKLERVKNPQAWGHYFRQSPIKLSRRDFKVFDKAVRAWSDPSQSP